MTLHEWRTGRSMHIARGARARGEARDDVLVVEIEFENGPLHGRRMTGLAWTGDLHVVPPTDGQAPSLVDGTAPASCLGSYRFVRAYDCARTLERVHVHRWEPSRSGDGS